MSNLKRALLSVWDKDGIVELGQFLANHQIEIISTGGTQKILEDAGLTITSISDITGMESIMDGRVKTLDHKIFGGILADRSNDTHMDALTQLESEGIDLVVVNFYPFVEEAVKKELNFKDAMNFIDIGGPSMMRAAAKNYQSVIPLCQSSQYSAFMEIYSVNKGDIPIEDRIEFASRVFSMTSQYEKAISEYFNQQDSSNAIELKLTQSAELRYGENPHQSAGFYLPNGDSLPWKQHQGKALSFNNYADMESAYSISSNFNETVCTIIKHANPCGFAVGDLPQDAYLRAVTTDPVSYFGGIVGFNQTVDGHTASELIKSFLECIIAPDYTDEAYEIFKTKKNLRVVTVEREFNDTDQVLRSVAGGYLVQEKDCSFDNPEEFKTVTELKPDADMKKAMELGWTLVRHVKSNAIVYSDSKQLLGVGAGQMSRVDSVKIGIRKVKESGLNLSGAIVASDAFFPFPDSIELAAKHGITGVIQPGGSIKDSEVIKRANELGLVMVFTGKRHFYH